MATSQEHREIELQHLHQLCGYITTDAHCIVDHHIDYMMDNGSLEININRKKLIVDFRDYLEEIYPQVSAKMYELDKAYNELSNVLTMIDHPQERKITLLLRTAYSEMNDMKRKGKDFTKWNEKNPELYYKIKNICNKLLLDTSANIKEYL